jgi:hypothetical protein
MNPTVDSMYRVVTAVITRHQNPTIIHEGIAAVVPGIAPTSIKPIIALSTESLLSSNMLAMMRSVMMILFCDDIIIFAM